MKVGVLDFEHAVDALLVLDRRGRHRFASEDFAAAMRLRDHGVARELLAEFRVAGILSGPDHACEISQAGLDALVQRLAGNWEPLVRLIAQAPELEPEARPLITAARVGADGRLRCGSQTARAAAPRLATILWWAPGFRDGDDLAVPEEVLFTAMATSLMRAARQTPSWVKRREEVGHRAEAYSVRRAMEKFGANNVLHVAGDVGDRFGYDVEVTDGSSVRLVEVKGSRSAEFVFVLSAHEFAIAEREPERYELEFWGDISLDRDPSEEYAVLTAAGYPWLLNNVVATLAGEEWSREPAAWKFRRVDDSY
jgi:hypothetical protein